WHRWLVNVPHCYLDRRIPIERCTAPKHFIHDKAQRIDIGGGSDNFALELFRRTVLHIYWWHAKTSQLNRVVLTYQYFGGAHVVMNNITSMSGTESKCDIMGNDDSAINLKYSSGT